MYSMKNSESVTPEAHSVSDLIRIKANSVLDPKKKSPLGQFFTPSTISFFMASLFDDIDGDVIVLDPGCGSGSLTHAFVEETIRRGQADSIDVIAYDIEPKIEPFYR